VHVDVRILDLEEDGIGCTEAVVVLVGQGWAV
jgi:hypothetical protein